MSAIAFDPFDPAVVADPYPAYRALREAPREGGFFGWLLTRYDDVSTVLRDPTTSAVRPELPLEELPEAMRPAVAKLREHWRLMLLMMDPPGHTRLRRLVAQAFTPRVVEALRGRVESIAAELLARRDGDAYDVIGDLGYPLPMRVICELIGLPPEDADRFKMWSDDLGASLGGGPTAPDRVERQVRAAASLDAIREYLVRLIADRRGRPRGDLLSGLIAAEEEGERLSSDELVATCVLLLGAGHETTTNLIGNGTLALLRHPDGLERLRRDPSLLPTAVEELLRYDSPVQAAARVATAPIELDGATIRPGEWVSLMIGAANRDPRQFSDPDRVDVGRREARHLSFGHGPHFCLGAALARLEAEVAFRKLVVESPPFELAQQELVWKPNAAFRGLESLQVRFRDERA